MYDMEICKKVVISTAFIRLQYLVEVLGGEGECFGHGDGQDRQDVLGLVDLIHEVLHDGNHV